MNKNVAPFDIDRSVNGLVSVVIPTYNHAHFIKQALQSVIDQTYTNWEAIVVDNHSEDNTDSIINSFADARIKILKIYNNGVIAVSRNLGIKHARGKWVAFLDSDDWWYPEKLELSVKVLKNGAQLVCHAENWIKNGTLFRTVKYGPQYNSGYRQLLFGKNCFSTSAVTVLRESVVSVDNFTENPKAISAEDYHLWLKLSKGSIRTEFIDQPLGCYRIYAVSQSSNLIRQMKAEQWVLKNNFKALNNTNILDHILRIRRYGRLYISTTIRYLIRSIS